MNDPDPSCDFQNAWREGKKPKIDDYLEKLADDATAEERRELLLDLVGTDLEERWRASPEPNTESREAADDACKQCGSPSRSSLPKRPRLADYVARYPELGSLSELPAELIINEYYAICRWEEPLGHHKFLASYRRDDPELCQGLREIDDQLGLGERALVEQAVSGNQVALQQLLLRDYDRLLRHIRQHIPSQFQGSVRAHDILQATHIEAFRSIDKFCARSDFMFPNWLYAIADNFLLNAIHAVESKEQVEAGRSLAEELANVSTSFAPLLEILLDTDKVAKNPIDRQRAEQFLTDAVQKLPAELGEIVKLRCIKGRSIEEVANCLGEPPEAIYRMWDEAKKTLHNLFRDSALDIGS